MGEAKDMIHLQMEYAAQNIKIWIPKMETLFYLLSSDKIKGGKIVKVA